MIGDYSSNPQQTVQVEEKNLSDSDFTFFTVSMTQEKPVAAFSLNGLSIPHWFHDHTPNLGTDLQQILAATATQVVKNVLFPKWWKKLN